VLLSGISRRMMLGLPAMSAVEGHERVHVLKGVELILSIQFVHDGQEGDGSGTYFEQLMIW
jgi:hypothetical protein